MRIVVTVKTQAREEKIEFSNPSNAVVYVKERPVEGKANAALVRLLSHHFRVPRASILIKTGLGSKNKIIDIALPQ